MGNQTDLLSQRLDTNSTASRCISPLRRRRPCIDRRTEDERTPRTEVKRDADRLGPATSTRHPPGFRPTRGSLGGGEADVRGSDRWMSARRHRARPERNREHDGRKGRIVATRSESLNGEPNVSEHLGTWLAGGGERPSSIESPTSAPFDPPREGTEEPLQPVSGCQSRGRCRTRLERSNRGPRANSTPIDRDSLDWSLACLMDSKHPCRDVRPDASEWSPDSGSRPPETGLVGAPTLTVMGVAGTFRTP